VITAWDKILAATKLHGQHDHSVERKTLGVHSDGSSNDSAPEEGFLIVVDLELAMIARR
jgi:hypothetical protein